MLDTEHHSSFHDLVTKFGAITGVGGMLNTSFNLHGDPIVCSPEDAIHTFANSGLDVLQLENFVAVKRAVASSGTRLHARHKEQITS